MNAKLLLHQKRVLKKHIVVEIKLWEVSKTKKYPDGIRYSLIAVNTKTKKRVLMDNHSPKGHHYHLDKAEFSYEYNGSSQLIEDFKSIAKIHMGVTI